MDSRKLVCHVGKAKRWSMTGLQIHHQREKDSQTNGDIDRSRTHLNYDLHNEQPIKFMREVDDRIKERVSKKPRKDAVVCVEMVVSANKNVFDSQSKEEQEKFFKEAYDLFSKRYGKENVVYAVVHNDELTPHMHFGYMPITKDNRLCAKDIVTRRELRSMHQDFFEHMKSKGFDVERGTPTKAKHLETNKWKNQKLKEEEKRLEGSIGELLDLKDKVRPISEIKTEEHKLLGIIPTEKVLVEKKDMEHVQAQAIHVARLRGSVINSERANDDLKGHLKRMGQELQRLRGVAQENEQRKEIEKHVDKLAMTLDLVEEELGLEFDLEDDGEMDDEEDSAKKRRNKKKLTKRKRPVGQKFGRHLWALKVRKGLPKSKTKTRGNDGFKTR